MIPVGRTVIVPANGSLPNICLSPRVPFKLKRVFAQERFDVLHLHEPMTPAVCVATLALAKCALVATWHAAGGLNWMRYGLPSWGFLLNRIDHYIAVSDQAKISAERWMPYDFEVIPNGVLIPPEADPANRENSIVFIGRHDPRKGMPVLLQRVAGHPPAHRCAAAAHRGRPARRPAAARRATASRARGSTCSASSRRRS